MFQAMLAHVTTLLYYTCNACYLADTFWGSKLENETRILESFARENPRIAAILYNVMLKWRTSLGGGFQPDALGRDVPNVEVFVKYQEYRSKTAAPSIDYA